MYKWINKPSFWSVAWLHYMDFFATKRYWSNHWRSVTSGEQRSDDDPGATAWLYAPYQILVLAVAYCGHCYCTFAVFNVIIWRHVYVSQPMFWRSLLMQSAHYSNLHAFSFLDIVQCVTVMNTNYHLFKVGHPRKTVVNATTKQFIP